MSVTQVIRTIPEEQHTVEWINSLENKQFFEDVVAAVEDLFTNEPILEGITTRNNRDCQTVVKSLYHKLTMQNEGVNAVLHMLEHDIWKHFYQIALYIARSNSG